MQEDFPLPLEARCQMGTHKQCVWGRRMGEAPIPRFQPRSEPAHSYTGEIKEHQALLHTSSANCSFRRRDKGFGPYRCYKTSRNFSTSQITRKGKTDSHHPCSQPSTSRSQDIYHKLLVSSMIRRWPGQLSPICKCWEKQIPKQDSSKGTTSVAHRHASHTTGHSCFSSSAKSKKWWTCRTPMFHLAWQKVQEHAPDTSKNQKIEQKFPLQFWHK